MRVISAAASFVLGAAVLVACTERNVVTAPAGAGAVAADFTNGPPSPGESGILRFNDLWAEVLADPEAGYKSIHGFESSVDDVCKGLGIFDEASFQVKTLHADEVNSLLVDRGQAVQVFAFIPGRICLTLRGVTPVARGTVNWRRTDNNFTETGTEGGRADSFGWAAEGVLDATAGGRVHYNAELRLVINPQTEEATVTVRKIRLTPAQ